MSQIEKVIRAKVSEYLNDSIDIRRHLHQYPELSFEEFKTQIFIKQKLDEWKIENHEVADTGLIATIKGKNPDSKLIVLRGDIDGLPIMENTGLSFASKNEGVMHACGHDVHTTCVLGAGRILNELRDQFEGTIKLLFQPGEEKLPGGASKVIASGALDDPRPDLIIGEHVFAELEAGKVGFRPGLYMASADEIYIDVRGPGGHAAMPDKTVDSLKTASQLILALKDFVDEHTPIAIPTVLTFGKIEGLGATNVIPKLVHIEGTFRTLDEGWRERLHYNMQRIVDDIAKSSGATIELEIRKGYPCLINNDEATNQLKELAVKFLGEENVVDLDLRMTSEDFSFYTQKYPSCFYRLGTGTPGKEIANLHSPDFIIDENALETGIGFMAFSALNSLK